MQLAQLAGGLWWTACASPAQRPPAGPSQAPDPIVVPPLPDLFAAAGLTWIVIAKPQAFTAIPGIDAGLARLVPPVRRRLFERATGIRIDSIRNLVAAGYRDATVFAVDGVPDPLASERLYRDRLMTDIARSARRHDVIITRGKTSSGEKRALVAMGSETVLIESGSWLHTRVAALYAEGKLLRAPRALDLPDVRMLIREAGDPPLVGVAPGPFEGEWHHALHGLLGVSTAGVAGVRPDQGGTLRCQFLLAGEWDKDEARATERLIESWNDIARSPFGTVTGLNEPEDPPKTRASARIVSLSVALNGVRFSQGLHDAVSAEARDLLRL